MNTRTLAYMKRVEEQGVSNMSAAIDEINRLDEIEIIGALRLAAMQNAARGDEVLAALLNRAAEHLKDTDRVYALVVTSRNNKPADSLGPTYSKIAAIKLVREYLGLGLKDAKDAVEKGDVVIDFGNEHEMGELCDRLLLTNTSVDLAVVKKTDVARRAFENFKRAQSESCDGQ